MELRQLRYFVAVADTLNFSRASKSLFVSQSALSKQISELEQELGVTLFVRDKRSVELTKEGLTLLAEAKPILLRTDKLIPLLRHETGKPVPERRVYIALEPRAADDLKVNGALTDAVYRQRQKIPGLRALFWREEYVDIRKRLQENELDLGIFLHTDRLLNDSLEACVLCEEEMVLTFRSEHAYPESQNSVLKLLDKRGVMLLEKESRGMAQILSILDAIGSSPQIRFCGSQTALLLTVESGEGTAILPRSVARRLSGTDVRTLPIRHPTARLFLLAAWRRELQNELAGQIARETAGQLRALSQAE